METFGKIMASIIGVIILVALVVLIGLRHVNIYAVHEHKVYEPGTDWFKREYVPEFESLGDYIIDGKGDPFNEDVYCRQIRFE
jgi:hypothetical protein